MIVLKWSRLPLARVIGLVGLSIFLLAATNLAASNQDQSAYMRLVRAIATARFGVPNPTGLAFASDANAFLLLDAGSPAELVRLSPLADPLGTQRLPQTRAPQDPLPLGPRLCV